MLPATCQEEDVDVLDWLDTFNSSRLLELSGHIQGAKGENRLTRPSHMHNIYEYIYIYVYICLQTILRHVCIYKRGTERERQRWRKSGDQ